MIHRRTGVVQTAFNRLIAREAEVRKVESVGEDFRLVTLAGEDLENRSWTPGDMFQIAFAGWESRSYTPCAYDPRRGTVDFLGYVHGHGIGSAWLASAQVGERRFLFGPRSAVDLSSLRRPAVFFGDETSFSTAAAMKATPSALRDVAFLFEVTSIEGSRVALDRLGLTDAVTLVSREDGDRHLDSIEDQVLGAFGARRETQGVLTGKASSIQRLYKSLRRDGASAKRVTNVAYWAPGKKGFSGVQR